MNDLISRQAAIEEMREMYHAAEKWGQEAEDDTIKARAESCMASLIEMKLRLEKLPMSDDLISREAAIEALSNAYHGMISDESMKIYQVINFINELPQAQRWIPVSERLP